MERDLVVSLFLFYTVYFNSHAHVERDVFGKNTYKPRIYFNSHAHVERDLTETVEEPTKGISTHTLTWSVTYGVCLSATHLAFQLTRSRGA